MPKITQELVNDALNRACENGYVGPDSDPDQVAVEMCDMDVDFEGADSDTLVPYIRHWQHEHGRQ